MRVEQGGNAKACGVCTMRKFARSIVPVTRPSASTLLTVSAIANRRNRRAAFAAAAIARVISAADANGRAASCTSTMSGRRAPALRARAHRRLPGRAARHRRQRRGRDRGPVERGIIGMDHRLHERCRLARPRSRGSAGSPGRPVARIAWADRRPTRSPRPAATTTAATDRH